MTENEAKAIKWIKNVRDDAVVTLDHIQKNEPNVSPMLYEGRKQKAETIIAGFEELQQYREIGLTPEMVKNMIESEKLASHAAIIRGAELELYQAIGTVEECSKAMEKYLNPSNKFVNPALNGMTLIRSPKHIVTERIMSILCDKYGFEGDVDIIAGDIYEELLKVKVN